MRSDNKDSGQSDEAGIQSESKGPPFDRSRNAFFPRATVKPPEPAATGSVVSTKSSRKPTAKSKKSVTRPMRWPRMCKRKPTTRAGKRCRSMSPHGPWNPTRRSSPTTQLSYCPLTVIYSNS